MYGPDSQPTSTHHQRGGADRGRGKSDNSVPLLKSLPSTKEEGRALAGLPAKPLKQRGSTNFKAYHRSQSKDFRKGLTVCYPNRGNQTSLLRNGPSEEWRTWPEISIRLSGLQIGLHIPDIYERLRQYGQVEAIELFTAENGMRDGRARVRMSGVKEPFWNVKKIQFNAGYPAKCQLEKPRSNYWTIDSPLDSGRRFLAKQVC